MTQLDAAKSGQITEEMKKVAKDEEISVEFVLESIAKGCAVLPQNVLHKQAMPKIIGEGFSVKVNANIGTSMGYSSPEEELKKAQMAFQYGADAVMVLSTWGDLQRMRKDAIKLLPVPVGSVPIYDAAVQSYTTDKNVVDFSEKDFMNMLVQHAKDGIDFVTLHVGVTNRVLERLFSSDRVLKMVSRGGSIIAGWMIHNKLENPFYAHFDEVLDIAHEYDVTLSLGDGMRPGAAVDGSDELQFEELFVMSELVEKARKKGVQVMIEGPGHIPLDQIEMNVKLEKKVCHGAPFFVLGPLVTDVAPGYDHITSAIGGALAAYKGVDFLCYVTPAEHLGLPNLEDVREGVIASKIAAIAADVAHGNKRALRREKEMAMARKNFDWEKMFQLAVNGKKARKRKEERPYDGKGCSMCGPFCALKIVEEAYEERHFDKLDS